MTGPGPKAPNELKANWPLLLASLVGFSFPTVLNYSLGLFLEPLGEEFGWKRAQISVGLTMVGIATVLMSPFVGAIIDRWGSRRLAIVGTILVALSTASFGLTNGSMTQWLTLWAIMALVKLGVESTVWTTAVSGVFVETRGLALGITMCGGALTQILAPPVSFWLIDEFGWRIAFFALGLGWGGMALVIILLFFFDAHDRQRRDVPSVANASPSRSVLPGLSIREALRSVALWKIGAASFITMFVGLGVLVHQVPILTEAGVTRGQAALLASLSGISAICGKLFTGYLMDGPRAGEIGGVTLAISAVGFFLLLERVNSPATIALAMVIIGYSTGAKLQISAFLVGRYAGLRNFGKIFGVIFSLVALGSSLGPVMAGAVYDIYGNYTPLLLVGIPGSLISGLLITRLGPCDYARLNRTGLAEAA